MIHGSISGSQKGRLVVLKKGWGKITAAVYTQFVLLSIYQFYREVMAEVGFLRAILMEDGASAHTAKLTQIYRLYHGIIQMEWPANSPDLNPIKNIWQLLKYRVGRRFLKAEAEVRSFIEEEWAKPTVEDFENILERSLSDVELSLMQMVATQSGRYIEIHILIFGGVVDQKRGGGAACS
jgi:hypothetical protein